MQCDPNTLAFAIGSAKLESAFPTAISIVRVFFFLSINHFKGLFECPEALCLILDGGDWRGCDCIAMDLVLRPSLRVA
jgi:hypothetical protein